MGRREKVNILILGIGNILFQDEGMGVHFIHYLDEKYEFISDKNSISIVDGGTLAQRLIPLIIKYDEVLVVDCIDSLNSNAGDVFFFDYRKVPSNINWQGSAHEVEMLQTLNMIEMNGDLPTTYVLGIVPKRVADDTTFDLSSEIIEASKTMEKTIIDYLLKHDIKVVKTEDVSIEDIAKISFKRDMKNGPRV